MAAQPRVPDSTGSTATNKCLTIKELLEDVENQLSRFNALKLDELKTELNAFVNVQQTALAEYKAKYDSFVRQWCEEGKQIEQLRTDLICSYGNDNWKKLIKDTVCKLANELLDLEKKIENRKGEKERARDEAEKQLNSAKANLEAWKTAAQEIERQLSDNQKLITDIQNSSQGNDRAYRLYLLWFQLLPAHNKLTPAGKSPLHADESPENLCGEGTSQGQQAYLSQKNLSEPGSSTDTTSSPEKTSEVHCGEGTQGQKADPSQGNPSKSQSSQGTSQNDPCGEREAPWIIDPSNYESMLDRAFCCYKAKKEQYADSVRNFEADPDSLDKLNEKLNEARNSLIEKIKQELAKAASAQTTDNPCA